MKPKVLNEWVASRVQAPDRTFKKMCLSGKDDFRYTHSSINDCGDPPESTLSERFRTNLTEQKHRHKEWVYRPQKFMKMPNEPLCFKREIKYMSINKTAGDFRFRTHATWENFQTTLKEERVPGQKYYNDPLMRRTIRSVR